MARAAIMKTRSQSHLAIAGFAIVLAIWEAAGQYLGPALLAAPSVAIHDYIDLLREGAMLSELAGSMRQMLIGFLLACLIGMPLGVAMGRSDVADAIFRPWVSMFVVTSTAALVPLLLVLLGTGFAFRATIVFLAAVWYIVLTTYNGARGVDRGALAVARSFGASRMQTFTKVLLPALFPYLITGARIGLVHAIRAMVMAEMFVIVGYGGLIHRTGLNIETGPLLGLLFTIMVVSVLATWCLRLAGRWLAPWYEEKTAS